MTINPLIPGFQEARRNGDLFTQMRTSLNNLQRQMASGKRADTFGGLGFDRRVSLDFRAETKINLRLLKNYYFKRDFLCESANIQGI